MNRSLFVIGAFVFLDVLLDVLLLGGKLVVVLPFVLLHFRRLDLFGQCRYGVALILLLGDNLQGCLLYTSDAADE